MTKIPPYLKKGDRIAIACPAGYMPKEKAQTCIATLQQWGFEVMVGNTLGSKSKNYFSGTDEIRLNELQAMLDDKSIKAILCGRGGYGVSRIIDQLDFTRFKKNPKWIIGFSDITLLHAHINRNLKIATLHAPMAAAFNNGENKNEFINSLHKALVGKKAKYVCKADPFNKLGEAKGELVGGNLTLITHLIGTKSDINTKNKILFIEDIGELIYSTDRMLHQLKRSGKLTNLAALIVGGFSDVKDTERPFGKKVKELIKDILQDYDYPVCFDFPVGHKKENYALKIGSNFQLKITKTKVLLSEL
jgi:muramoyltetrapeptide carboxypeptidase